MKAFAAFTLCSFASIAFAGTEVSHSRYRDDAARAEYSWTDGCASKSLTVMAVKTKLKEDGATPTGSSSAEIRYFIDDTCGGSLVQTSWFGESSSVALQVDSNLRFARLTVPALTLTSTTCVPPSPPSIVPPVCTPGPTTVVSIDITWTSSDPVTKYAGTIVTKYPGYTEMNHLTGWYRLAAATGQILNAGTNWLPPASAATLVQLFRLQQGETIVTKD